MSERQIALVLAGGGARAAYQAGVIHYMRELAPEVSYPIMTGVSAGAINAAYLAGNLSTSGASGLVDCWQNIDRQDVFESESNIRMFRRVLGGIPRPDSIVQVKDGEALLNTGPLRDYLAECLPAAADGSLPQVEESLQAGHLRALCMTTTSFTTGQSVTWVQGRDIEAWQRPNRVAIRASLTLDHVMASAALPLLFPAVKIRDSWYGDGGIRLTAPLSPALHLGATDIIVISTRYDRSQAEASHHAVRSYPPAAQVMGILLNAIFLDVLDQDAQNLQTVNRLVSKLPKSERGGLRPVNCLLLRPSMDIGRLASGYESKTRGVVRLLTRGLGSGLTESPDWLSVLLFDSSYICSVVELGWNDARRQQDRISAFLERGG